MGKNYLDYTVARRHANLLFGAAETDFKELVHVSYVATTDDGGYVGILTYYTDEGKWVEEFYSSEDSTAWKNISFLDFLRIRKKEGYPFVKRVENMVLSNGKALMAITE